MIFDLIADIENDVLVNSFGDTVLDFPVTGLISCKLLRFVTISFNDLTPVYVILTIPPNSIVQAVHIVQVLWNCVNSLYYYISYL